MPFEDGPAAVAVALTAIARRCGWVPAAAPSGGLAEMQRAIDGGAPVAARSAGVRLCGPARCGRRASPRRAARPTSASTSPTSASSSSPRRCCWRRCSSGSASSSARARSGCCARSASRRRASAGCSPPKDCCWRSIGSVIGIAGAVGYGAAMMAGLRTWWSGAVGTTALTLHVSPSSLIAGAAGAAAGRRCSASGGRCAACRSSPSAACSPATSRDDEARPRASDAVGDVARRGNDRDRCGCGPAGGKRDGRDGSNRRVLRRRHAAARRVAVPADVQLRRHAWSCDRRPRQWPLARLGVRNTTDRPGRSVLAIAVIASATFILISVDAFRRPAASRGRSPFGHRRLSRCSSICCCRSRTIPTARAAARRSAWPTCHDVAIEPFRVLPGDDASCLNLYEPTSPRILGVSRALHRPGPLRVPGIAGRRPMPSARTRGCC